MDVVPFDDPAEFLAAAGRLLLADEARHNLLLGIAGTLRDRPGLYAEHRLWLVRDRDRIVGAAIRTPPLNLILGRPQSTAALDRLAEAIDEQLPGVVGALPEVETFAGAWAVKTGATPHRRMAQGVYALERVRPVSDVPGAMRAATEQDRPLLREWLRAFGREALPDGDDDEGVERILEGRIAGAGGGFVVWEDAAPVSLAGFGNPTPNGMRVGPVYTPPERRGRGYASALVAELSAQLLAGGRTFCFLYTDLANPTSNRIYERIGYERVCESAEIAFQP